MAQTGLGPSKLGLAKGSSGHPGWIMHRMTVMVVLASPGH